LFVLAKVVDIKKDFDELCKDFKKRVEFVAKQKQEG